MSGCIKSDGGAVLLKNRKGSLIDDIGKVGSNHAGGAGRPVVRRSVLSGSLTRRA